MEICSFCTTLVTFLITGMFFYIFLFGRWLFIFAGFKLSTLQSLSESLVSSLNCFDIIKFTKFINNLLILNVKFDSSSDSANSYIETLYDHVFCYNKL